MDPLYSVLQAEPNKQKEPLDANKSVRYSILLAPFQPTTKIDLETVINTSTECYLDIINTGFKTLHVTVTKLPCVERQITLSLSELKIKENSVGTIHITWFPKEAGCWRDVVQLTDNRRIKYDIIIGTTAKSDKKIKRTGRKPLLPKPNVVSVSAAKKPFQRNKTSSKTSTTTTQPLVNNLDTQVKQYKSKYESDLNKENVFSKNSEVKINILREKDDEHSKINRNHECNKPDVFDHSMNVSWKDGSVLPQTFLPLNRPQDIRRATYIKEEKSLNNILHKHDERVTENAANMRNTAQFDISTMLNKFTLTSADALLSSPQVIKKELTESTNLQDSDKHRTFDIIDGQFLEAPATQAADLNNLSLNKFEMSFVTDVNGLIASSPIGKLQHCNMSKESKEHLKHFTLDVNQGAQKPECEYFSFEVCPENIEAKKAGDLYIEISPPKHSHSFFMSLKSNTRAGKITKNKTLCDMKSAKKFNVLSTKKGKKKIEAAIKANKLSLSLSKAKWNTSSSSKETSFRVEDKEESFIYEAFELDPFAPSTIEDPFLKNTVHYDEQWLLQQELVFTKWLNALLSSPEDLSTDIETVADIGKIWQLCKTQKETVLAETKEVVSARYHTSIKLNILRKAASAMFNRTEVTEVLSRTNMCIVKGTFCIRSDRNLQRDIGLQKLILGLFFCYNPLWLRIGLETIYCESIPLRSNNDIVGLTRFLLARFFSDPRLTKMPGYHKSDPSQKFVTQLNQFILKKFLFLVYFLDYAKQRKLIGHDPCLFHKRAQYKESRDILLSFTRELLSGIGDVTRVLRGHNYVLSHRQTYIEEYDYAMVNIRHDLRDGVRLCRAMELITGARGLTQRCRVPAISRLQKVHNAEMALNALRQAGYTLKGDIDAKSIVDGHCEKTLSLLWQIIHKYQAPRFDRSSRVIQKWWRAKLWYINVRNHLRARRNCAAVTIQRAWRRRLHSWRYVPANNDLEERKRFLLVRRSAICVQRWWRRIRETKRLQEIKKTRKAVIIQRRWRALRLMRSQREQYLQQRNAALLIQRRWRATRMMLAQRFQFVVRRYAARRVAFWWRNRKIMREQRERFLQMRESACVIQVWWRRRLSARKARNNFLLAKVSVRTIERWWMSVIDRKRFLQCRKSAILIQRAWRECRARKREAACAKIQAWWKAALRSREYKLRKSCCVKLQRWWRGVELARRQRAEFLQLRNAALIVQRRWRAKAARRHYLKQQAVLKIQSWCRRAKAARIARQNYLKTRGAAIRVQNWWRSVTTARQERGRYLQLRRSVVLLQNHWRRRASARADRERYLSKRRACIALQSWWRMIKAKSEYGRYKSCVLTVQRRWRAIRAARAKKKEQLLTRAAVVVQARWRALTARRHFLALRRAAMVVQSRYRTKIAARRYKIVKRAALTIQMHWRGRRERLRYLFLRRTVIALQRCYRQKEAAKKQREHVASIATKIHNECEDIMQIDDNVTAELASQNSYYWQDKIDVLRNCKCVGKMILCLSTLDTMTKLSMTICGIVCELNLTDDIYNTLVQYNRSMPWMKVYLQACSILITLAKYSHTKKYVLKKNYALGLVKLLSKSLKDKDVFLHCATLIWLLSQDEDYLKNITTCSEINWLMRNIKQKVLKDITATKFQKLKDLKHLYPSCEPDRYNRENPRLFADMTVAVVALVSRIGT
ncbi:protein abnormal spindle [Linepithema humile]|uniref:protein abnormal spindle n=1 Tax=Linepithema humile TaxID=83485 RepID=UPI0006234D27|nr:PREDICTED: abnormal spindle-like microcephaly-associated protein homolog [Linepithema humile]XP_012224151.1 PREDICTED: abnormal spindle-like microcephaly-associated protein homolog [Linepithema humile]